MNTSCSAAGLLVQDGHILLVKPTYGANKGRWMLPGGIHADGAEISETRFLPIEEALRDLLVIDLTKEMILAYLSHKNGLFHLHKSISTNNSWAKYEVFV